MKTKEAQEHNTDTAGAGDNLLDAGTVNRNSTLVNN